MAIEIKFESNQDYQTEAIEAVTGLFDGVQKGGLGRLTGVASAVVDDQGALIEDLVYSNFVPQSIEFAQLVQENVRKVQMRRRNSVDDEYVPIVPVEMHQEFEPDEFPMDYSIEMETGTGKTYVYLRTAIELYLQYGLSKFVIVVPSVAIREGVISSLRLMKEHFKELYAGIQYDSYVYDSKNVNKLRQFATSSHLQILVMNIAAFNSDDNIIRRQVEGGYAPIDFIHAVRPVVIMDEPQKLSGANATKAISDLNAAFRLRYSATHKDLHHLLYRLTPIDAYDLRLVKRINVLSVTADENANVPLVFVKKITNSAGSISATLEVNKDGENGTKQVVVKRNDDLREITGRQIYEGWIVENIEANSDDVIGNVLFQNGQTLPEGTTTGIDEDAWQRARIRATILDHFDTELRIRQHVAYGAIHEIKALTLFFIDRVANYAPEDGKFRIWFEEEYEGVRSLSKYRNLDMPEVKDVHGGYFASTKQGPKDSTERGNKDDDVAYDLIMKDKEKLLSFDTPLRFIFSHSALAEGWDNPNVFTICNLQAVQSEVKRRQQIGRGLRLPVMVNGERCRVDEVNHLTVIASEAFEDFAKKLQKEMKDEAGVDFADRIKNKKEQIENPVKPDFKDSQLFVELWNRISKKTTYRLDFKTDDLVAEAVSRLKKEEPISVPKFRAEKQAIATISTSDGIVGGGVSASSSKSMELEIQYPDILTELSSELPISRATIKRVIEESGRFEASKKNPAQFSAQVARSLNRALAETLRNHDGIKYEPTGDSYSMEMFDRASINYEENMVEVKKSIYERIPVDSNIERQFAQALDARDDIELFIKLPGWYKVETPVGGYNPDWAIVRKSEDGALALYLIRETKGSPNLDELFREAEAWKVVFGYHHFKSIDVSYDVVSNASQLDNGDLPEFADKFHGKQIPN